ncbi:mono/diheme cytochrome c family protein [Litoreibacter meonggei]|uniref:Mono/diheme cytochrome c family protein n=1 Tax=Litoreibacter meonggei TaxID=1049199 RepID=A0A497VKS0_9RHOB|nr:cytochrome c [Litoreibacter meonggei]RLJ40815.1 mono/diheme cytochrome c family protein [Litoreibacter meonggei]
MKRQIFVGVVLALTAGIPAAQAQRIDAYNDPATVAEGKLIYDGACASCHGADLEGQPNWRQPGPDGKLPAPPHDVSGHTWHHAEEQLFVITKFGTEALVGGTYKSDMRGFQDELTDAQIKAVLAFIKSTWPADVQERHSAMTR